MKTARFVMTITKGERAHVSHYKRAKDAASAAEAVCFALGLVDHTAEFFEGIARVRCSAVGTTAQPGLSIELTKGIF